MLCQLDMFVLTNVCSLINWNKYGINAHFCSWLWVEQCSYKLQSCKCSMIWQGQFSGINLVHMALNSNRSKTLPSIEEAWSLPIPAELTSRQGVSNQQVHCIMWFLNRNMYLQPEFRRKPCENKCLFTWCDVCHVKVVILQIIFISWVL